MRLWSETLQISCESLSVRVPDEDFGIAWRIKAPSCHLSNPITTTKCRKLKHEVNEDVWNSNNSVSFVQNFVPSKGKYPLLLLIVLHLLCASCVDVHCHSPQNVAKNIGERVVMSCSSDDTVHPCQNMVWTHYAASSLAPTVIFTGGNLISVDYISIADSNDGKCNLEIKAQTSAEGKYECSSPSAGEIASASLIILDGYPECAVETVGEYSNITCWVKYFGDWAPTIEWIGQNSTSIGSYETYTSDKIVGATLMISRNTHSSYKFFMKFNEQGKKTRTIATNVPDYEWISPIFVLGENGEEGAKETACPQQMCSAGSFGFNGHVVILSLFLWFL